MRKICWEHVDFNLREAAWEVRWMVGSLGAAASGRAERRGPKMAWGEGSVRRGRLYVSLQHAAHHLNYAWNGRRADEARARRCEERDFERWSRFPSGENFREFRPTWGWMMPFARKRKGRGEGDYSGGIDAAAALPHARPALRRLRRLRGLVAGTAEGRGGVAGLDEAGFGRGVRGVYRALVRAWEAATGEGVPAKEAREATEREGRRGRRRRPKGA